MFEAPAPVYAYWLEQIHVMAGRAVQFPASAQLNAAVYNLDGGLEGRPQIHPFREAYDNRRREFRRRWVHSEDS